MPPAFPKGTYRLSEATSCSRYHSSGVRSPGSGQETQERAQGAYSLFGLGGGRASSRKAEVSQALQGQRKGPGSPLEPEMQDSSGRPCIWVRVQKTLSSASTAVLFSEGCWGGEGSSCDLHSYFQQTVDRKKSGNEASRSQPRHSRATSDSLPLSTLISSFTSSAAQTDATVKTPMGCTSRPAGTAGEPGGTSPDPPELGTSSAEPEPMILDLNPQRLDFAFCTMGIV
jgi:hypothetical protein